MFSSLMQKTKRLALIGYPYKEKELTSCHAISRWLSEAIPPVEKETVWHPCGVLDYLPIFRRYRSAQRRLIAGAPSGRRKVLAVANSIFESDSNTL